jgi:nucleosome binding factor SPN SPT16 subunit
MNIKWDALLKKIRTDPEAFMKEENGWRAFFSDSERTEEQPESGDSEFEEQPEEEEEEEEEIGDDEDFDEEDFDDEDAELESLVDEDGEITRGRMGGIRERRRPQEEEKEERKVIEAINFLTIRGRMAV